MIWGVSDVTFFEYIKSIKTPSEMASFLVGFKYGLKDPDNKMTKKLIFKQRDKLLEEIGDRE